jgi:Transposon-encoded protein TnpV
MPGRKGSRQLRRLWNAMDIERKFASRRSAFLVARYPAVYAEFKRTGELDAHLEQNARHAREMMEQIFEQNRPQIEAIQDKEKREAGETQVWLMAEEAALHEIVLTL